MKHFYAFAQKITFCLAYLHLIYQPSVQAQLSIDDVNSVFTIDFDNNLNGVNNGPFAATGFEPAPAIGQLDSDAWAFTGFDDGDLTFGGSTLGINDAQRGSSTGGEITGGIYAFDIGGGNLSLGVQPTEDGWTPGSMTLRLQNNSGETIKGLQISYQIYQFNDEARSTSLNFSHSSDDLNYTPEPSLDFATTEAAIVPMAIWIQTQRNLAISGLDIAPGDFYYLRWESNDAAGTMGGRDEIALDNIGVQVLSSIAFQTGDWRPQNPNVGFDDANAWESFDGTAWVPEVNALEGTTPVPDRVIIDQTGIAAGNSDVNQYDNIFITAGGSLTVDATVANETALTGLSDFISATNQLEVQSNAQLIIQGDIRLAGSAQLIVRAGGTIVLDRALIDNEHPIWNGMENFEAESTFEVRDWDFSESPGQRSIINATPQISNNANGYKFGNLVINSAIGDDFTLVSGPQGDAVNPFLLCENDLEVNSQTGTNQVNITFATAPSFFEINGSIIINEGLFNFVNSTATLTHTLNVKGDIIVNNEIGTTFPPIVSLSGSVNVEPIINLEGRLVVADMTTFNSADNDGAINFVGMATQNINVVPALRNINLIIKSGSFARLIGQDLEFDQDCRFTVETGATLDFGTNGTTGLNIIELNTGNAFQSEQGSTLMITNQQGINRVPSGNIGNVQVTTRTYAPIAIFHYTGRNATQSTGTALSTISNGKIVIVELGSSTGILTLSDGIGISNGPDLDPNGGRLEIRSGILRTTETETIIGSGNLVMTGGEYQIGSTGNPLLPRLTGSFLLTGGVIHLNGNGDQVLKGARDYFSLTFSGSGTKTTSSALTDIDGVVTITEEAVLDVGNSTFSGSANLVMTGDVAVPGPAFRMRKLNTTLPELSGTYTLDDGAIELYDTDFDQTHSLRGGITYHDVFINAMAANQEPEEANVVVGASFDINGTLNVVSPATFQVSNRTIEDGGSGTSAFNLQAGAGLKYGSAEGINLTGNTGNIQTVSRTFNSAADYYLIGGVNQVTGDGIPDVIRNLFVDKSAPDSPVQMSKDISVSSTVQVRQGDLDLNGQNITLLAPATLSEDRANNHLVLDNSTPTGGPGQILMDAAYNITVPMDGTLTDIAGLGVELTNTGGADFTVNVSRQHQQIEVETGNFSILKSYTIEEAGGFTQTDMNFFYADDELNGLDPSGLALYRNTGTPDVWEEQTGSDNSTPNLVSLAGITELSDWTLATSSSSLPIQLLSFQAKAISESQALLEWQTISETNNQGFEIEKSMDGVNFDKIAFVDGAGTHRGLKEYAFVDQVFLESAYYRLKQIDFDGQFAYSPIAYVDQTQTVPFRVYPNPVAERVVVQSGATGQNLTLSLTDLQGKVLWELAGEVKDLEQGFNQQLPYLKRGQYILRFYDGFKMHQGQIIKQ